MPLISSLNWVKKGAGKTPTKIRLDNEEFKDIFAGSSEHRPDDDDEDEENEQDDDENKSEKSDNSEQNIEKKYNLDKYDEEEEEIKLERLNSLACFSSNVEDAYLTKKDDGEDSDEEDMPIKENDNLIVCGTINDDDSCLNVYVYNEECSEFYIHHDILLPYMPICVEWLDYDPTITDQSVNYVAVGCLNPWIEIWDLDLIDSLEPEFILGSDKKKKKKKIKEGKKKAKVVGHTNAVLSLAFNPLTRTSLASGSVDKSIVLWDLESLKQNKKIKKQHTDKVQSLKYHPSESHSLLSGSADQTVKLFDCRDPLANNKVWHFDNEIEKVLWNVHNTNEFLCSDNGGFIHIVDQRKDKPLKSVNVSNDEPCSVSIALSARVPGLMVTADENEIVKIWDIKNNEIEYISQKKFKSGAINCLESSPDSGFVFSFGGTKSTSPLIWDLRELTEVRKTFYERVNMVEDDEEVEEEQLKEQRQAKRKARAEKFKTLQLNNRNTNNDYNNNKNTTNNSNPKNYQNQQSYNYKKPFTTNYSSGGSNKFPAKKFKK